MAARWRMSTAVEATSSNVAHPPRGTLLKSPFAAASLIASAVTLSTTILTFVPTGISPLITGVAGDQAGDQPLAAIAALTSSAERTALTAAKPATPIPIGPMASPAAISPPATATRLQATGLLRHQLMAGGTVTA